MKTIGIFICVSLFGWGDMAHGKDNTSVLPAIFSILLQDPVISFSQSVVPPLSNIEAGNNMDNQNIEAIYQFGTSYAIEYRVTDQFGQSVSYSELGEISTRTPGTFVVEVGLEQRFQRFGPVETFTLTIVDTTPPTIKPIRQDISQFPEFLVLDNGSEQLEATIVNTNFNQNNPVPGVYFVDVFAEDEAGNSTTETFRILTPVAVLRPAANTLVSLKSGSIADMLTRGLLAAGVGQTAAQRDLPTKIEHVAEDGSVIKTTEYGSNGYPIGSVPSPDLFRLFFSDVPSLQSYFIVTSDENVDVIRINPVACPDSGIEGEGTEESPYLICSAQGLVDLANGINNATLGVTDRITESGADSSLTKQIAHVVQTADLFPLSVTKGFPTIGAPRHAPMSGLVDPDGLPINTSNGRMFSGSYNGGGFQIYNLQMIPSGAGRFYAGLFGRVVSAEIRNVVVTGATFLALALEPTLGGIIAQSHHSLLTDSEFLGTLGAFTGVGVNPDSQAIVGGLIGDAQAATKIENSSVFYLDSTDSTAFEFRSDKWIGSLVGRTEINNDPNDLMLINSGSLATMRAKVVDVHPNNVVGLVLGETPDNSGIIYDSSLANADNPAVLPTGGPLPFGNSAPTPIVLRNLSEDAQAAILNNHEFIQNAFGYTDLEVIRTAIQNVLNVSPNEAYFTLLNYIARPTEFSAQKELVRNEIINIAVLAVLKLKFLAIKSDPQFVGFVPFDSAAMTYLMGAIWFQIPNDKQAEIVALANSNFTFSSAEQRLLNRLDAYIRTTTRNTARRVLRDWEQYKRDFAASQGITFSRLLTNSVPVDDFVLSQSSIAAEVRGADYNSWVAATGAGLAAAPAGLTIAAIAGAGGPAALATAINAGGVSAFAGLAGQSVGAIGAAGAATTIAVVATFAAITIANEFNKLRQQEAFEAELEAATAFEPNLASLQPTAQQQSENFASLVHYITSLAHSNWQIPGSLIQ